MRKDELDLEKLSELEQHYLKEGPIWQVYGIVDLNEQRIIYVGVTSRSIRKRAAEHRNQSKWCKGRSTDVVLLREDVYGDEASIWEQHYIKEYDTLKNGCNSTHGGVGTFLIPSEKTKEKLRQLALGNQHAKGTKRTPEMRKHFSEIRKGKATTTGQTHSPETRAKMSAAQKGKKRSKKNIENNRLAQARRAEEKGGLPLGVSYDKRFDTYYVRLHIDGKGYNLGQYGKDLETAARAAEIAREFRESGTPIDNIKHSIFTAKRFKP